VRKQGPIPATLHSLPIHVARRIPSPAATDSMAPAKSSMKKTTKHKHHMAKKKMMKKEEAPKG